MINESMIEYLNCNANGANIDLLESHILDFKQASELCDMSRYIKNYIKLSKILKEINPESSVFSDEQDLSPLSIKDWDRLLIQNYYFKQLDKIYGCTDSNIKELMHSILKEETDLIAILNVRGLHVSCLYINGYIYRIYAVSDNKVMLDITNIVKNKVPANIDGITNYKLVDIRGVITLEKNETNEDIECTVMHKIRCKLNTDDIKIVFNDIIIDGDLPYSDNIGKMEFINDLGLCTAEYGLVRNIDIGTVSNALEQLGVYFSNILNELTYSIDGFCIKDNSKISITNKDQIIHYITDWVDSELIFKSVVKNIDIDEITYKVFLDIQKVKCNDNLIIDTINIDDIYDLERYNIGIGSQVSFRVYNNKACLCIN